VFIYYVCMYMYIYGILFIVWYMICLWKYARGKKHKNESIEFRTEKEQINVTISHEPLHIRAHYNNE
jgi:arginine exporter protein ArgO